MRNKNQIIVTREPAALTCRDTLSLSTWRVFQLILDFIKRPSLSRRRGFVQLETGQRSVDVKTSQRWHRSFTEERCEVWTAEILTRPVVWWCHHTHTQTVRPSERLHLPLINWQKHLLFVKLQCRQIWRKKQRQNHDEDGLWQSPVVDHRGNDWHFEHQPQISSFEVICGSSCGPTVGSVSGTWCEVHSYWDKDKNVFTVAWRKTCSPVRSVRPNQHDHRSREGECRFDLHSSEPFWHFFLLNHDECLAGNRR